MYTACHRLLPLFFLTAAVLLVGSLALGLLRSRVENPTHRKETSMFESLIRYPVTTFAGTSPVQCLLADWRQARAVRHALEDALLKLERVLEDAYPPSVRVLVQSSVLDGCGKHVHGRAHHTPEGILIIRLATETAGKPVSFDAMVSALADSVFQQALGDSSTGDAERMVESPEPAAESPAAWRAERELAVPSAPRQTGSARPMLLQHTDPLAGSYAHEAD